MDQDYIDSARKFDTKMNYIANRTPMEKYFSKFQLTCCWVICYNLNKYLLSNKFRRFLCFVLNKEVVLPTCLKRKIDYHYFLKELIAFLKNFNDWFLKIFLYY